MTGKLNSYLTRPLITILLLGFFSGLPLALTGATLATWLADAKVDIRTIGLFASVGTPYALKFLWSPLMDSLPFPLLSRLLGRRRGWIMAAQIALCMALVLLALTHPADHTLATAVLAVTVAFLSASQDIVIDAYRVETLSESEQGEGAAMIQLGYRLGMIASSAGALYLATSIGWPETYIFMAGVMAIGGVVTMWAKEPEGDGRGARNGTSRPSSLAPFLSPFLDFTRRRGWLLILAFVMLYKFADAFIGIVTNPFLLAIGFDKKQIANILKIYGTIATLLGTLAGGSLVVRYGTVRILFIAGFLHAVTNLLYALQAHVGADTQLLAISVAVENISGGISSAAFVAFLSNLCNRHYTATQYALLSSLAALGRTWLATPAGYAVKYLGWEYFFMLASLLAAPGLVFLWFLEKRRKANPA